MAHPILTSLSLFSGIGGLDIGVHRATGARVLGYVERDAYAASVLLARMEDSSMESAPVWVGSIEDVDLSFLVGRVDIVVGGFPCQDVSVAGARAGIDGQRTGLWREVVRVVREVRPRYVFLENVPGLLPWLGRVLGDLAEIGLDAEWTCVRASDVGASHRRERVFILAHCQRTQWRTQNVGGGCRVEGCHGQGETPSPARSRSGALAHANLNGSEVERGCGLLDGERTAQRDDADGCHPAMADAARGDGQREASGPAGHATFGGEGMADTCRTGSQGQRQTRPHWPTFPPGPSDTDGWARVLAERPDLAPSLEPSFRDGPDGPASWMGRSRADQLRCLGNGVVPAQAELAFRILWERIHA